MVIISKIFRKDTTIIQNTQILVSFFLKFLHICIIYSNFVADLISTNPKIQKNYAYEKILILRSDGSCDAVYRLRF